jgi:hypothetical protein
LTPQACVKDGRSDPAILKPQGPGEAALSGHFAIKPVRRMRLRHRQETLIYLSRFARGSERAAVGLSPVTFRSGAVTSA